MSSTSHQAAGIKLAAAVTIMKRRITTILFSLSLSIALVGQERQDYIIKEPVGIASVNEAAMIAEQIVKAAGLKANFLIAEANVPNALAVYHQGKRYVLYNPGFVNRLTRATGTKWAAVSVLAHEIGHHLYHSLTGKPAKGLATELEADQFSGFVLENMGASLEEAQAAMSLLATPYATTTHPGRKARMNSIATGWENAGGILPGTSEGSEDWAVSEPDRFLNNRDDEVAFPNYSILAKLHFNNSPGKELYITSGLNVVRIVKEQMSILGTISKSGNDSYPFVIADSNGYRLYISAAGQVVNARGRVVGKLTKG